MEKSEETLRCRIDVAFTVLNLYLMQLVLCCLKPTIWEIIAFKEGEISTITR